MPASWSFWYDALPPVVLCGIVVAILHVSHWQAIGSSWIYPWIFPWISTKKSVDMDVDMDGKFHIHGKPGYIGRRWLLSSWTACISSATVTTTLFNTRDLRQNILDETHHHRQQENNVKELHVTHCTHEHATHRSTQRRNDRLNKRKLLMPRSQRPNK